jgi:hypothetical protein
MLNHRLAALLVFLICVIYPLAIHWVTAPGGSWLRPYIVWTLIIIASWLWQRRREPYEH